MKKLLITLASILSLLLVGSIFTVSANSNLQAKNNPYANVPASIKKKYYDCYGKTNRSAKNWIAYHESDYSIKNQEKTTNSYVKNRYGSWSKAKVYWKIHKSYMQQIDITLNNFSRVNYARKAPKFLSKFWNKFHTVKLTKKVRVQKRKLGVFAFKKDKVIKTKMLRKGTYIKVANGGLFGWVFKGHGLKRQRSKAWFYQPRRTNWMKIVQ